MNAFYTLVIALFFSTLGMAQNTRNDGKLELIKVGVVLDHGTYAPVFGTEGQSLFEGQTARLYKHQNARVKMALTFATKKDRAKMA